MKMSQYFIPTTKELPKDAVLVSHQLMLRAGLIRKEASGLYIWLPLGLRVLQKVEAIVRDEMNRIGALEMLMPVTQPAELWIESGRFEKYGAELLRFKDRHDREFCLGPTHEEVITDIMRRDLNSYKQLPLTVYQIQTKFRDEIRPRFGLMRAREFMMKDAYSFHLDQASLQVTFDAMYKAYGQIFSRMGLAFRAVLADSGSIGGNHSIEFHVLADSGEDELAYAVNSHYAANIERAQAKHSPITNSRSGNKKQKVDTGDRKTIQDVATFLGLPLTQSLKCLMVVVKTPLVCTTRKIKHLCCGKIHQHWH